MPEKIKARIREAALTLLRGAPDGLRYKDLHQSLCEKLPDVSPHTISSEIHTLRHSLPGGSVTRGVYRYAELGANGG